MGSVEIPSNVKDPKKIASRRAQIVNAAVRLFAEKGFHPTTTREIAKASGLSSGALYEYVQSKEDILLLVCRHIHSEVERQVQESLVPTTETVSSGCGNLKRAIWSLLKVMQQMSDEVLLIYQESKSLPAESLSEVLDKESAITGIFEKLIDQGIRDGSLHLDVEAASILAHQIVVSAEMWAFRRWALRKVDFRQFAEIEVNLLMQACGARDSEC